MIIFISLILLICLGVFLLLNELKWNTGVIGGVLIAFSGIILAGCLISLITNPIEVKSDINKFLATKTTIEQARENEIGIENAAVRCKIIESNQWLSKQQHYNSTIYDIWIPDEVDDLKPIE